MGVPSSFLFIFLLCLLSVCRVCVCSSEEPDSFIVFMSNSEKPQVFATHHDWYSSIIHTLSPLSNHLHSSSSKLLYTYEHVAHGFCARLTPSQASELAMVPGVISVLPDDVIRLQTTRTPQFLGLTTTTTTTGSTALGPSSDYGADMIIGVLDSGIWPGRRSFSDQNLSPIPDNWRNKCEVGPEFPATSCNRKIIGARAYYRGHQAAFKEPIAEPLSAIDWNGHGTHVASIAAGSAVANANFYGYAQGEAKGVATKAKIAVYKVCWDGSCTHSDILSGMDQAVADGVHVLSLSLSQTNGSGYAKPYYEDAIAIGAFGAVARGIIVSSVSGNNGPDPYTARNIPPWILTVGASSIDREFPAVVTLGNGRSFTGTSLYSGVPPSQNLVPVVYGEEADSYFCEYGELDASKVKGKIVYCEQGENSIVDKGIAVQQAGGVGMIVPNTPSEGYELEASADMIPTSRVTVQDGDAIFNYIDDTPSPTARIEFRGTVTGNSAPSAPRVAAFSGRGPNLVTPEILKPDAIAPGLNILAAWTDKASPSGSVNDTRTTEFNIISGTSMAAPHVSGLAAMLKKLNPTWSPAAIKSALMTTAYTLDNSGRSLIDLHTGQTSVPHAHGSGHVDPTKAVDPGLVYDTGSDDYVNFLCTIGYNTTLLQMFVRNGTLVDCSNRNLGNPGSLNYPSFSVVFKRNLRTVTYKRTVTNVGRINNPVYNVAVTIPSNVRVTVSPNRLAFSSTNNILSYEVTFTSVTPSSAGTFGSLVWSDGTHVVTSPIVVTWPEDVAALHSEL